jgi:hypothetical protein
VTSHRTREFHDLYNALSPAVQRQADKAYAQFAEDPNYAGLNFKDLGGDPTWYSARIGISYRALCRRAEDGNYIWFWIGTHAEYDKLLKQR